MGRLRFSIEHEVANSLNVRHHASQKSHRSVSAPSNNVRGVVMCIELPADCRVPMSHGRCLASVRSANVANIRPIRVGEWPRIAAVVMGCLWGLLAPAIGMAVEGSLWSVGVARVDATPATPIRLSGFAFRKEESAGVRQKLWAKGLAIGTAEGDPVVIVTLDAMAISDELVQQIVARIREQHSIPATHIAVTVTHSHTAPMLTGVCPTLFGAPIPDEHQAHIDQYTRIVVERAAQAGVLALQQRQPATLEWGRARVGFARNRRTSQGPVDHDLPVLIVKTPEGTITAVYTSYACHCVTLSDNRVSGDWAGYAQEHLERLFPNAVALVSVGCGADSNPSSGVTGDKGEVASAQGLEIAEAARRLADGPLSPVTGPIRVHHERLALPYDTLPTRSEWEQRGQRQDAVGYHARYQLAKLDRGEGLPTELSYPVQTISFGDSLAMVFLSGEVVVDYALRLKRELDASRLWTNGYSNGVPGYIPSERIWKEGGYEGGDAMIYFDRPVRFAQGLEQPIIDAVHRGLVPAFALPQEAARTRGSRPMTPEQSRAALHPRPGHVVDLIASEPLVTSPVAIDFGPDGSLWVAEMYDYPLGLDGNYQPGGRVRRLNSSRGDGRFDQSTVFLEDIPFPTGITVWRNGVLVCAAPDILFAADTDGDGRADDIRKLFSGFGTHNYQARVNSLEYGLDGWVYGSCGLFGGRIVNFKGETFELGDQDFRIRPDTGEIEPATGRTQQGRPRDDAGNWFGCDNSTLCRHYPLPADAVRRNPHVPSPPAGFFAEQPGEPFRLFPSRDVQLFKLSGPPGRATAACGLGVYRDELLGADYRGNVFTCEPVNLLVHRMQLVPRGSSFAGQRAPGEESSEFLTSDDTWFRPVQARTGPDGALWIVDMYRYIIEHPRWIPPEEVAQLDVRAGHDRGRVYRVRPHDVQVPALPRLDQKTGAELAEALDSPNGWQRDMAMQLILWNNDHTTIPTLLSLAETASRGWTRMQALVTLDLLKIHPVDLLSKSLSDPAPEVRRQALRIAGPLVADYPVLAESVVALWKDVDPQVRLQCALTLGLLPREVVAEPLAELALQSQDDPFLLGAVVSSLTDENALLVLRELMQSRQAGELPPGVVQPVIKTVLALADAPGVITAFLSQLVADGEKEMAPWQEAALLSVLESLAKSGPQLDQLEPVPLRQHVLTRLDAARARVVNAALEITDRQRSLNLLGWHPSRQQADRDTLLALLTPQTPGEMQASALAALQRLDIPETAAGLLAGWRGYGPSLRGRVLDTLLARPAWQKSLLDAVAAETVAASEIDVTRRDRLMRSRSPEIQEQAIRLLQAKIDPDRAAVLARYEAALELPGQVDRGRQVFTSNCAQCHVLEGKGHAVGPDLSIVASKSPRYLLQEILDPNRNTDSRYLGYTVLTIDGQTFAGVLAQESANSVTLRGTEGREQTLLRSAIEELQSTGKSLMPEGLEKDLSIEQVSDLLAYLGSRRSPPKQVAGNRPELITQAQGQIALTADHAAIHGGDITFEGAPFYNIGLWHGVGDQLAWDFEWPEATEVDVWLHFACHPDSQGNRFVIETASSSLEGKVTATGGWNRYQTLRVGRLTLQPGRQQLRLRPQGPQLQGALLDLQGVYLTPLDDDPVLIVKAPARPAEEPDTPQGAAGRILDDTVPEAEREALIRKFLHEAPALLAALTSDLKPGTPEEYRRIPWIWRVAIAAGKQNEAPLLTAILDHSLPLEGQPLHDWQAVVIGGGLINGISQLHQWPGDRLAKLMASTPALETRWMRTLEQAGVMVENEKVPTGTRYDALRMIPLRGWRQSGSQLQKYLARGVNEELQMGAVSGTIDVNAPEATAALLKGLAGLTPGNRTLALDGLLRDPSRVTALLDALETGQAPISWLNESQRKKLLGQADATLRRRAEGVVKP